MPAFSAPKVTCFAHERTCDNASHFVFSTQDVTSGLANLIQLRNWNYFLMGRNLKNGIRGGIYDRFTCLNVFGAEFLDYFGTRCRYVSEYPGNPSLTNKTIDDGRWEPIWKCRESLLEHNSGHLPVPCRSILTVRH